MEVSIGSSFSVRGTRYLWRSWTVPKSIPGGNPNCIAHCWRAWARATVSSLLTMWMYLGPCILGDDEGRKSRCPKPARLREVLHQLSFFLSWWHVAWKLKPAFLPTLLSEHCREAQFSYSGGTQIPTTNSLAFPFPYCMLGSSHRGGLDLGFADVGVLPNARLSWCSGVGCYGN